MELLNKTLVIARKAYLSCGWKDKSTDSDLGLGYNLCLEAYVSGKKNPKTGLLINLTELDIEIKKLVKELDHKHLNYDIEGLKSEILNEETFITYCFKKLKAYLNKWPEIRLVGLKLYKGDGSSVEISSPKFWL